MAQVASEDGLFDAVWSEAELQAALGAVYLATNKVQLRAACVNMNKFAFHGLEALRKLCEAQPERFCSVKLKPRWERAKRRAAELGNLGMRLYMYLKPGDMIQRSLSNTIALIGEMHTYNQPLRACAHSMLLLDFPIQVKSNDTVVSQLFDKAIKRLNEPQVEKFDVSDREARKSGFPLKAHPGAENKANVFLSEVSQSLQELSPMLWRQFNDAARWMYGLASDDQATAVCMAGVGLNQFRAWPMHDAVRLLLDPQGCKSLNLVLKALGLNSTSLGARLCEAQTLQGRGVGAEGVDEDRAYRVSAEGVKAKVHKLDMDKLREGVRYVYSNELRTTVEFDDVQDHWSKRWLWCVNGSHSRTIERIHPEYKISEEALTGMRLHRKVFAEHVKDEVITEWDGNAYFAQSLKLEPGKTRCIYAGDSLTYFAFEHLLNAVERVWYNQRVILDPGHLGTYGMSRRLKRLKQGSGNGVNIMLDYDDFNARHSNEAMAMVIDELVKFTGYDETLGKKLSDSFYNSWMYNKKTNSHDRIEGTLMSGHRATTFINSVLNFAYIYASSKSIIKVTSIHVGDDVYILSPGYDFAWRLLKACEMNGLAMNPMKQSIGEYTAEFLRVAYAKNHCIGYLMRSIAATVAGNWVNEIRLSYKEGIATILNAAWTLGNRATEKRMGLLLKASLRRMGRVGDTTATNLLTGSWAISNGPCRYRDVDTVRVELTHNVDEINRRVDHAIKYCANSATTDYLSKHATPVEQYALANLGTDAQAILMRASYSKTMIPKLGVDPSGEHEPKVKKSKFQVRGMITVDNAWNREEKRGVLTGQPLLELVKEALNVNKGLLQDIVECVTGKWYSVNCLEEVAWGTSGKGCAIRGYLSYSDACNIAAKLDGEMVPVYYQCYV